MIYLIFEPEFNAVFKIRADFHDRVARSLENEQPDGGKNCRYGQKI